MNLHWSHSTGTSTCRYQSNDEPCLCPLASSALVISFVYKQKKGRMKRNGARNGMMRRLPPHVKTDIIMAT